jgi:hypothetical protein
MGTLRSKNPVEQVAALVWLSGRHLPSTERRVEGVSQEPLHQAQAYEAVRDSKVLREILIELKGSPIQLVKDYALFTDRILTQDK